MGQQCIKTLTEKKQIRKTNCVDLDSVTIVPSCKAKISPCEEKIWKDILSDMFADLGKVNLLRENFITKFISATTKFMMRSTKMLRI
jgi:hypothetical protein